MMEQPSSSPSSPAKSTSGIRLPDCVEELVRFTLSSSRDGTLGADLGVSSDYCARLLQDEDPLDDSCLINLPARSEVCAFFFFQFLLLRKNNRVHFITNEKLQVSKAKTDY